MNAFIEIYFLFFCAMISTSLEVIKEINEHEKGTKPKKRNNNCLLYLKDSRESQEEEKLDFEYLCAQSISSAQFSMDEPLKKENRTKKTEVNIYSDINDLMLKEKSDNKSEVQDEKENRKNGADLENPTNKQIFVYETKLKNNVQPGIEKNVDLLQCHSKYSSSNPNKTVYENNLGSNQDYIRVQKEVRLFLNQREDEIEKRTSKLLQILSKALLINNKHKKATNTSKLLREPLKTIEKKRYVDFSTLSNDIVCFLTYFQVSLLKNVQILEIFKLDESTIFLSEDQIENLEVALSNILEKCNKLNEFLKPTIKTE